MGELEERMAALFRGAFLRQEAELFGVPVLTNEALPADTGAVLTREALTRAIFQAYSGGADVMLTDDGFLALSEDGQLLRWRRP